ncbi:MULTISPECIES: type II secretion system protein [Sporosarcina]|uniref:Prepilin-type N-terminal cleavage/methylation domain-containing protein n=1 Tax=Sporosarcina newyorkensis TaxID=759851 RepID=A0A1T4XP28_9BACL|nr:type II secretion system protein [Sporosarcina newyorkensis]SKA90868.1 prepilin-type N-terminal cleavage/methylation domain-containing protein [Sporosarcina newyorkensis]
MKTNNEKGMTLVEILAALVILGIVFIGFMTIFPQMNNMNNRTETKLETMNLAKKVLADFREASPSLPTDYELMPTNANQVSERYTRSNKDYFIEVICSPREDSEFNNQKCNNSENNPDRKTDLYKIHIEVKKEEKIVSESFGYIVLD